MRRQKVGDDIWSSYIIELYQFGHGPSNGNILQGYAPQPQNGVCTSWTDQNWAMEGLFWASETLASLASFPIVKYKDLPWAWVTECTSGFPSKRDEVGLASLFD